FPGLTTSGDIEGWMYLNLNNGGSGTYSSSTRPSQNWVVIDMYVEGQHAFRFDAAALGNGCSPAVSRDATIGPAGGTPVCPAGAQLQSLSHAVRRAGHQPLRRLHERDHRPRLRPPRPGAADRQPLSLPRSLTTALCDGLEGVTDALHHRGSRTGASRRVYRNPP